MANIKIALHEGCTRSRAAWRDEPIGMGETLVHAARRDYATRYQHALALTREERRARLDERNEMSGLIDRKYLNDYYSEE